MAKLNPIDILGATEPKTEPKSISDNPKVQAAKRAGARKPSPYETDLRARLRDKVQFNVGTIPRFVNDTYEIQAKAGGMNKREYFYHLLRQAGGDIPAYSEMDARKL